MVLVKREGLNPRAALSAPAMSVRSKISKSAVVKDMLELELKHMKEKQKLDKEGRELELEMKKQEIERRHKFEELQERRKLQELEIKLAKAQLEGRLEIDDEEQDLEFNRGEIVNELVQRQDEVYAPIVGTYSDNVPEENNGNRENGTLNQPRPPTFPRIQHEIVRDSGDQPHPTSVEQPFLSHCYNRYEYSNEGYQPQRERQDWHLKERQSKPTRPIYSESTPQQYLDEDEYHQIENPVEPKTKTQPIFEQQREILRMMAATIGSTISKGFEMPKRVYDLRW